MFGFKAHSPELSSTLRRTLGIFAFIAGASFCFEGDKWHKAISFYYINQLPIPWLIYGCLLMVAAICLSMDRTRPIGYLIGAITYSFFSLAVWLAVIGSFHPHWFLFQYLNFPKGSVSSFFAAGNITTIAVLYWSSLKYAIYAQIDPDRIKPLKKHD